MLPFGDWLRFGASGGLLVEWEPFALELFDQYGFDLASLPNEHLTLGQIFERIPVTSH